MHKVAKSKPKPRSKQRAKSSPTVQIAAEGTLNNLRNTSMAAEDASSPGPVYFWRPMDQYGFLGQWYASRFHDPSTDQTFTCCEQYMMYHKAVLFNDPTRAAMVLETDDPKTQKALGRIVTGFDPKVWDLEKLRIVEEANMLKFGKGAECLAEEGDMWVYPMEGYDEAKHGEQVKLRDLLLATGDRELVEASPRDRIWGVGFAPQNAGKVDRARWGQNLLGKALMEVRRNLREADAVGEGTVAEA